MGCTIIGSHHYLWTCTNVSKPAKYFGGVIKYDLLQMFAVFKFNTKRGHKIWPSTCVCIFRNMELLRHRLLILFSDNQPKNLSLDLAFCGMSNMYVYIIWIRMLNQHNANYSVLIWEGNFIINQKVHIWVYRVCNHDWAHCLF
jgi:hypothetical protein